MPHQHLQQERLMLLDLSFTQVTGDVKVFVGNQQLQILKLASAPVFLGTASGQIVLRTLCAQWTFEMFFEHVWQTSMIIRYYSRMSYVILLYSFFLA